MRWLLLSLALQNLGRRKARSLLLIAAVALGSGVVFTGAVLMQSIDRSMAVGFTRLGADMMVVEGALTNIASLLVVEPTSWCSMPMRWPRRGLPAWAASRRRRSCGSSIRASAAIMSRPTS